MVIPLENIVSFLLILHLWVIWNALIRFTINLLLSQSILNVILVNINIFKIIFHKDSASESFMKAGSTLNFNIVIFLIKCSLQSKLDVIANR